jgi:hypothetical protein
VVFSRWVMCSAVRAARIAGGGMVVAVPEGLGAEAAGIFAEEAIEVDRDRDRG